MDDELLHRIDEQLAHVGEHHLADTLASIAGPPGWVPDDNWAYADEWLEHNNFYPGADYTDQTIERGPDYDWTVDHGDWNHTCDYCARRSVSRETEYEDTLSGAPVMSVNEGGARVYWAPPGEVEPPLVDSGWEQAGWIPLGVTTEGSSIRYEFNRPIILGPGETLRLGRSFHQIAAWLESLTATAGDRQRGAGGRGAGHCGLWDPPVLARPPDRGDLGQAEVGARSSPSGGPGPAPNRASGGPTSPAQYLTTRQVVV
jgi:hypothetical protein